jgi:hypothetical protein
VTGVFATGYPVDIFPGICGQRDDRLLKRTEPKRPLTEAGDHRIFVWEHAELTVSLVDQHGDPVPNSRLRIRQPGYVVVVELTHGVPKSLPVTGGPGVTGVFATGYPVDIFPGIGGQRDDRLLRRTEPKRPLTEAGGHRIFVWEHAELTVSLVDQKGDPIPASRLYIRPDNSPFSVELFQGVPKRLPVTDDPGVTGLFAAGYQFLVIPGINGRGGGGLLARFESTGELGTAGAAQVVEWQVASGPLHVVDANELALAEASIFQHAVLGTIASGTSVSLPITDRTVYPDIFGAYAEGYPDVFIRPDPAGPSSGPFTFKMLAEEVISPAFVPIAGADFGLRFLVTVADSDRDQIPDDLDNCPGTPNPDQEDLDADGRGDVCDDDDDDDGVEDGSDNCPIIDNPDQRDGDLDGLGDICDPSFDSSGILGDLDELIAATVVQITLADPPGANGLIGKLTGGGGVAVRVTHAVLGFAVGEIDPPAYAIELLDALDKLDAFEHQVEAKINNGQIGEPQAPEMVELTAQIRDLIDLLLANAPL